MRSAGATEATSAAGWRRRSQLLQAARLARRHKPNACADQISLLAQSVFVHSKERPCCGAFVNVLTSFAAAAAAADEDDAVADKARHRRHQIKTRAQQAQPASWRRISGTFPVYAQWRALIERL